jgi:hypothetical protein
MYLILSRGAFREAAQQEFGRQIGKAVPGAKYYGSF